MNAETIERRRPGWFWRIIPIPVALIQVMGVRWADAWPPEPGWRHDGDWTPQPMDVPPYGYLLALAGPVALFWLHRHPRTVIGVTAAATLVYFLLALPPGPVFLSIVVAVAGWARMQRRAQRLAALHARDAESARQAAAHRLRIAQELHDVLAHHISLINVQSGVALHLVDERPEQTRTALAAIKSASKEALVALRGALDTLRGDAGQAPRAPTGGLDQLDDLVGSVRTAGLAVTVERHGEPRPLPAPADLAALRIVQESLTNALRHSGADSVTVSLDYRGPRFTLSVTDDGVGGAVVPGNGLSGITERAAALGGTARFGPAPGGGFGVWVEFPI
ncbi:signal transduction histidine kinase [Stackebrandtia albiflava]|uniref:histidine kinase n=1 Tax=Stackebrandtia albiflava TaxID=406432 RepID=A0A562VGS0_9ACTN|nr:sensor histidine kinase [Stackebrandtia albiflava]TWJ17105.1 signal transduction histidine kinase [Stackebrandtia albiflava]